MYRQDDFDGPGAGGAMAAAIPFGRADAKPPRFDLVVDLGDRIGSPRWWRGLATLVAMIAALVHVAPGLPSFVPARPVAVRARPAPARIPRRAPPARPPEPAQVDLSFVLTPDDDLVHRLVAAGARPDDAAAVATIIATVGIAGDALVTATLGARGPDGGARPIARLSVRAAFDTVLTVRRDGARWLFDRAAIAIDETPLHIGAPIGNSLYRAMRDAGVPLPVLADYLQAIARHVDIDEISPGDRFDVVMANRHAATGEDDPGRLLYGALTHDGVTLELLRWTLDGHEQWLDAAGEGERRPGLVLPVAGQMTSGFGPRFHPILGYTRMHQGIDLAAPAGTPIVAAAAGVVRFAGWHGGHGNYVLVDHPGGMATGYAHMSAFAVTPGQAVRQGELLGTVGSTGLSTGPHCHFEVFRDGVAIDPAGADLSITPRLDDAEMARFTAARTRYAALPLQRRPILPD